MRLFSSVVSLLGPFGPRRSEAKASTPPLMKARVHRHNVEVSTPNADATSATEIGSPASSSSPP